MQDAHGALDTTASALSVYLRQVGRRVLWFKLVRGAACAAGMGLFALLICTLNAGPSLGWLGASLTWAAVIFSGTLAGMVGVGRLENLSGERRAVLLAGYDGRLSERTRSAAELARSPNGSPELVMALTHSVVQELQKLPVDRVVPRPRHWGRLSSLSLAAALGSVLVLVSSEEAASGLYAMVHPAAQDEHGTALGLWISKFDASITYPAHLGREAEQLTSPRTIHVPEGSVVELSITPRLPVDRAVLQIAERTLPMTRDEQGQYRLTLTAEKGGPLLFRARVNEAWVTDHQARSLLVDEDRAPVVHLDAPLADQQTAPDKPVPFVFRVEDDHGLESVDLVVQLGPGRERRTRLSAFEAGESPRRHGGSIDVTPSDFGAQAGQTLAVWLEARDRDGFGGPNVGRSPVRTIAVGEATDARGAPVELLERTRDAAVDTLGERLETPLPASSAQVEARAKQLGKTTRTLVRQLESLAEAYKESTGDAATAGLLRDMMQRLQRLTREEGLARDARAQREGDEALVAELEDDVLWLSDLIGRAKLSNAEQVLEHLATTRARMRQLLEQLKETDDPARRAELMAEIARARAELTELGKRLAQAQTDVPSDFVNYEALAEQASDDPLERLEDALARGDMAAAERAMADLDERLANLENGLASGDQSFADARFAPRNQAAEQARSEVKELERAQKQLANDTGRVAETARARSSKDENFRNEAEQLAKEADQLEQKARSLEAGRMQSAVSEAQASAAQRLRDARDALQQGDAQEARQMAQRAADDLGAVASEMGMDARMFPGADGSRADAARKAGELSRDVSRFAEKVAKVAPLQSERLSASEQGELNKQAPSQRALGEQADRLAQDIMGKNALPSVGKGLERAQRAMGEAAEALQHGDVREAQAHQRDALDRLGELSDELGKQAQATSRGGQREGDGGEHAGADEKVAIPNGGDDPRRVDLRRRVLDARRARAPDSFSRAVERYYQEILR